MELYWVRQIDEKVEERRFTVGTYLFRFRRKVVIVSLSTFKGSEWMIREYAVGTDWSKEDQFWMMWMGRMGEVLNSSYLLSWERVCRI